MKAAERAFGEDQKFMSQTFVAIADAGLDPCELRQKSGDVAVRDLVAQRIPLVEFVLRTTVGRFDLDTAEGRSGALDRGVPLVAQIKDIGVRDEYARRLAGLVGVDDPNRVVARVRGMLRSGREAAAPARPAPPVDDAVARVEREVLKVAVQMPAVAGPQFDVLATEAFLVPVHQRLRSIIELAGGCSVATSGPAWIVALEAAADDDDVRALVAALAVEPLRAELISQDRYADAIIARLSWIVGHREIVRLKSRVQRLNPVEHPDEYNHAFGELITLEGQVRLLSERAIGGT
jgi:DNA primase